MNESKKAFLLIVDDDPFVLSAFERLLRHEFNLSLAEDLDGARELITKKNYSVALIDLHLAKGTSLNFFREMQILSPTTSRVLMSGSLQLNSLVDSLQSNLVHKIVQKPWEPAQLILQMKEAEQLHLLLKEKERLELLSTTDGLTGLGNFRSLQEILPQEIERSARSSRPLSLIMIDVDGFKEKNDSSGHLEGDQVLKNIAHALKSGLRSFDQIFRYGGDEFCLVLQETSASVAVEIAERLRKKIAIETQLTISLGVSSYPEISTELEALLAQADTALYTAKSQGRNRTVVATPKKLS